MTLSSVIQSDGFLLQPFRIFICLIIAGFYILPSIIGRYKRNYTAIALLNLFLGWTFIGWVVALVWAVSKEGTSKADELYKLKKLLDEGVITQEEFEKQKNEILDN